MVDGAVERQDAVLGALGVRSPKALLATDLISASMRALVPAMKEHGVSWLSALGVGQSRDQAPPMLRIAFSTLLRHVGKDKAASEEHLRSSGLDWTLVYPPVLSNDPRTGTYRSGDVLEVKGVPKISRADAWRSSCSPS